VSKEAICGLNTLTSIPLGIVTVCIRFACPYVRNYSGNMYGLYLLPLHYAGDSPYSVWEGEIFRVVAAIVVD
jgi:hypothetical protein